MSCVTRTLQVPSNTLIKVVRTICTYNLATAVLRFLPPLQLKTDKAQEIKKLNQQIQMVQSDMSKHRESLEDCLRHVCLKAMHTTNRTISRSFPYRVVKLLCENKLYGATSESGSPGCRRVARLAVGLTGFSLSIGHILPWWERLLIGDLKAALAIVEHTASPVLRRVRSSFHFEIL